MSTRRIDELPVFFQPRHTDEYDAPRPSGTERVAVARVLDDVVRSGRLGTAQGLRALNAAAGDTFYDVPAAAVDDNDAANETFDRDDLVIDVQTHFVADRALARWNKMLMPMYRALMPDWWTGMDNLVDYSMAEYLRCVFLESETALAVLTSAAGATDRRMLLNPELAGAHELLDRLGAGGRLLNHTVVEPNHDGQLDAMERAREEYKPVGWKVYTLGSPVSGEAGWWLDDDTGLPFLQQAQDLGVNLVCAHKGMSALVDTGSPRDVGPAARAFPNLDFVIYHSGYESDGPAEGPYTEATADIGVNRLVTSFARVGYRAGRERLRRTRHDVVLLVAQAGRSRPRARQVVARGGGGQRHLGNRRHLVRARATDHRRVPHVPHTGGAAGALRLSTAHAEDQDQDHESKRRARVRHRSRRAAPEGRGG